jgi:hypothetical protein
LGEELDGVGALVAGEGGFGEASEGLRGVWIEGEDRAPGGVGGGAAGFLSEVGVGRRAGGAALNEGGEVVRGGCVGGGGEVGAVAVGEVEPDVAGGDDVAVAGEGEFFADAVGAKDVEEGFADLGGLLVEEQAGEGAVGVLPER